MAYCKTKGLPPGKAAGLLWPGPSRRLRPLRQLPGEFVTEDITRQAQIVLSLHPADPPEAGVSRGGKLAHQGPSRRRDRRVLSPGAGQPVHLRPAEGGSRRIRSASTWRPWRGRGTSAPRRSTAPSRFTERPGEALFQGATVTLTHRKTEPLPAKGKAPKPAKSAPGGRGLAGPPEKGPGAGGQGGGAALYLVFSNATLADMARRRPRTLEEFLEVSGVGRSRQGEVRPGLPPGPGGL